MAALLRGVFRSTTVAAAAGSGAAVQPIGSLLSPRQLTFYAGGGLGVAAVAVERRSVARTTMRAIGMASLQGLYGGGLSPQVLTTGGGVPHPLSSSGALLGHSRFSLWPQAVPVSRAMKGIHAVQPKANHGRAIILDEQTGLSKSDKPRTRGVLPPSRTTEDLPSRPEHGQPSKSTVLNNDYNAVRNRGARASNVRTMRGNMFWNTQAYQGPLPIPVPSSRELSSSALLDRFDDSEGSDMDVETYKKMHEISTSGTNVPDPVLTFASTEFPPTLVKELENAGFSSPSAIQAMTWPIASKSRDVVAVAKTGSGKTLGYLIPAFLRVEKERVGIRRRNPVVLVLAPTRELANQIREEAWKFGRSSRIICTCICGGASKGPQLRDLERGVDVIIATPGRLNDLLEMNAVNLKRVSYLVLDEADRMLDMGFEPQIRSIVEQMPPQRQTLMYTATWPQEVRRIARDLLNDPVQVSIGNTDQLSANKNITQKIEIISRYEKERRLEEILAKLGSDSKVLIFCTTRRMCEELAMDLRSKFGALALHGDKSQRERDFVMNQFRKGRAPVLVATDVAARGLDIKDIRMVINYDFPTGVEDYVHRIGRTGRAGATGFAHTFFGYDDAKHAAQLIKVLESTGQDVLPELRQMAGRGDSRKGTSSRWGGRNTGNRGQNGYQRGGNDGWKWGQHQAGYQRGDNDGSKRGQSIRPGGNRYGSNRFGGESDRFGSGSGNERFGNRNERFGSGGDKVFFSSDRLESGSGFLREGSSRAENGNDRISWIGGSRFNSRGGAGSDKSRGGNLRAKWGLNENGADPESTWGKWDKSP